MYYSNRYDELLSKFNFSSYEAYDYFVRLTGSDRNVLIETCKNAFGYVTQVENNISYLLVDNSYCISLDNSSLGSYRVSSKDNRDHYHFIFGEKIQPFSLLESNLKRGANIYTLLLNKYGISDNTSILELFRQIRFKYTTPIDRYLLSSRRNSNYQYRIDEIIDKNANNHIAINYDDFYNIVDNNIEIIPFPQFYNYIFQNLYWYDNEDGSKVFGVIYFKNGKNDIYKLPITMWQYWYSDWSYPRININNINQLEMDYLHPLPPYPIYNKYLIHKNCNCEIIICDSEMQADELSKEIINLNYVTTTYSGGFKKTCEMTDWKYLLSYNNFILFDESNISSIKKAYDEFLVIGKEININGFICKDEKCEYVKLKKLTPREFFQWAYTFKNILLNSEQIDYTLSLSSILKEKPSKVEFIFKNLLRKSEQLIIFGERGSSKSFFSYLLAISLSTGIPVLSRTFIPARAFRVLYIDGEMEINLIKDRIRGICAGLNIDEIDTDCFRLLSANELKTNFNFYDLNQRDKYLNKITDFDVVFIDSINFVFPDAMGNEISSSKALNDFILKMRNYGITTILVDHSSTKTKGKSKDPFGSSGKTFAADLIFYLQQHKNGYINLNITKSRSISPNFFNLVYKIDVKQTDGNISNVTFDSKSSSIPLSNKIDIKKKNVLHAYREYGKDIEIISKKLTQKFGRGYKKSTIYKILSELSQLGLIPN